MGIYIKGMELQTNCARCPLAEGDGRFCRAAVAYIPMVGHPWFCPLVEVPEHGRLVDADRLEVIAYSGTEGRPDTFDAGVAWLAEKIDALPTIIPEEEA